MAAGVYVIGGAFDFTRALTTEKLPPIMVEGNQNAHQVEITCRAGGAAADLSGLSCRGIIVNSNRQTYQLPGSIDGNIASVPLGQAAYAVSGPIVILVELYSEGYSATIYRAETTVWTGATDTVYDPAGLLPTVPELMAQAAAYQASLQAVIDDAEDATANASTAADTANAAAIAAIAASTHIIVQGRVCGLRRAHCGYHRA